MLPLLLLAPFVLASVYFVVSRHICWREFFVILGVVLMINIIGLGASYCGTTGDVELLNGSVVKKERNRVSCSHSYDCMCVNHETCSGSGKDRTCYTTRVCQTCYKHSYDIDWVVRTTLGPIWINRIDSQGLIEPGRWAIAQVGEPVSQPHSYTNYIKAAPNSVLRMNAQKGFEQWLPPYPRVYDYYRTEHIVAVRGITIPDVAKMQRRLSDINGVLGPRKQVNIIFVVTPLQNPEYQYALQQHWLGGKKNDVIVVLGVPDKDKIAWASVISWSEVELLKVQLRDEILRIGSLSRFSEILDSTEQLVGKHFHRKPMKDFAYLRYQYSPSPTVMWILFLLGIIASIGLSVFFVYNDPFDSGFRVHAYSHRYR